MDDETEMETVIVDVEWRSSFRLRVPVGTRTPRDLDTLMDLCVADPDVGDFDSSTAEVVDWEIQR